MECGSLLFLLLVVGIFVTAFVVWSANKGKRQTSPRSQQPRPVHRHGAGTTSRAFVSQPRPRHPRSTPEECWIAKGNGTVVATYELADGMVYVGRGLPPVQDDGWSQSDEPALIQPHLQVNPAQPDRSGEGLDYWPSYESLSARTRAGYLEWLANGRRAPDAPIGFVFLFFYGIERRVLVDGRTAPAVKNEIDGLLSEVEELLAVYGENRSFQGYASAFLEVGRLLHRQVPVSELKPPPEVASWEVPLTTKLALGALAAQGEPIPAEWALSWVLTSQRARLRTPAHRCRDEFRELFRLRYAERFAAGGLKIRPNKTRLSASYRPASPSFRYSGVELAVPDLPDVTVLEVPFRKLQDVVDQVTDELDAYSRWVGRKDDRQSPAALALLPRELAGTRQSEEGKKLVAGVEASLSDAGTGIVDTARLIAAWPSRKAGKLTRQESTALCRFLGNHGLGIEPDCRFAGPSLAKTGRAVVFRLEEASDGATNHRDEATADYQAAALLLRLAAAVATADGEVSQHEERHLREHVESGLELSQTERRRLDAHLRWLLLDPPGLTGLKRRLQALDADERHSLARFLVAVAAADGRFAPEEVKILRKVYPLLGLEADDVFTDLHALRSGDDEPVTVLDGEPAAGYAIPPAQGDPEAARGLVLDPEKIRATRDATERVSSVLAEVFSEQEPTPAPPPPVAESGPSLCGLDAAHSAFLLRISERPRWERSEIEYLADELGVLPEGALETINEAAIEACGDPLLEGDDIIEIDGEILQEMTA